ncbi:MAG: folylpolyglutamate synthase/dihydrofolate synthase family protein, partial [Bacteroidia bacterium]
EILKHPHRNFKCIHVAGTNGKGSSSHMIAAILQSQGYKVGLYTSPHLLDFRERIKINGKMIPKKEVMNFVSAYRKEFEKIQLSFFEWSVGLAFHYFSKEKVDFAVVEVGMGGRLDSTNVIKPIACLITNIGKDHQQFLGKTLAKIAKEKAGIIKHKIPVVVSETQKSTKKVFLDIAKKQKAPIVFADQKYIVKETEKAGEFKVNHSKIICELKGSYQKKNISGVLALIDVLVSRSVKIDRKSVLKGLKKVSSTTGLLGRWQTTNLNPLVITDTGHNIDGFKEILKNLRKINYKKLHLVLGFVGDKDVSGILKLLPTNAKYYFVKPSIERGMNESILKSLALKSGLKGSVYKTVNEGYRVALKNAGIKDLIFVGGSTFVVSDFLEGLYSRDL